MPAGLDQVLREGTAHDAEADHADRALAPSCCHSTSPRCEIASVCPFPLMRWVWDCRVARAAVCPLSSKPLIAYRPAKEPGGCMRVGVAGLGVMGAAVAARLMEVGHEVTVWNRTPEKIKPLSDAGAKVAATPAQLASAVEAAITMLTDAAAIDAVYNTPKGLLSGDAKGKLFIEMR